MTNGCSLRYSSGKINGALTAAVGSPPLRISTTCVHTSIDTFSCASTVLAPRCGVLTTLGCRASLAATDPSTGGSDVNTSSPAPAIHPSSNAFNNASSLNTPPLATLNPQCQPSGACLPA